MKRFSVCLVFLLAAVVLIGGAKPVIDASNDESLKSSANEVRNSLPEERRAEFDESLQDLLYADLTFDSMVKQALTGREVERLAQKLKERIHGKTAIEIIEAGNLLRKEREGKEHESAILEIQRLLLKSADAAEARDSSSAFEVTSANFYKKKQPSGKDRPTIVMTVSNNTSHAVSRVHFRGTLASPDRSVPWVRNLFDYPIPGGLEPGESARWEFGLNSSSAWATTDVPEDALLTVDVVQLDGADGATLWRAESLDDPEKRQLEERRVQERQLQDLKIVGETEESLPVGADIKVPVQIHAPQPPYTASARGAGVQGIVILEALIDHNGDVQEVKVLKGLPFGLEKSAIKTVKKWKFEPATLDGKPVAVYYNLSIKFTLPISRKPK